MLATSKGPMQLSPIDLLSRPKMRSIHFISLKTHNLFFKWPSRSIQIPACRNLQVEACPVAHILQQTDRPTSAILGRFGINGVKLEMWNV
ncbi:hypothetical protein CEXT_99991 [Caerostris extrusa]|uniref:Uncharacterized protein n=1 Tax=Caerostris extrusa TaxID=172846 RepID=A0AAV4XI18_CAEEX|nr:hypothetical protein CEXT_99991 [Caerostris extrusa]